MLISKNTLNKDIINQDEQSELKDESEDKGNNGGWLENALPLTVLFPIDDRLEPLTERLFEEIEIKRGKKFKLRKKSKHQLGMILINLSFGNWMNQPIRYSRDSNGYKIYKKYGELGFTYNITKSLANTLKQLEYIKSINGRTFYEDRTKGRQARMWASPALIKLFLEYNLNLPTFFYKPEPEEIIQLTNKIEVKPKERVRLTDKKQVKLKELVQLTDKIEVEKKNKKIIKRIPITYTKNKHTRQMEEDLKKYNELVKEHKKTVQLNSKVNIDNNFLFILYNNIISNKIKIKEIIYNDIQLFINHLSKTHNQISTIINPLSKISLPNTNYTNKIIYPNQTQTHTQTHPNTQTQTHHTHITQTFDCSANSDEVLDEFMSSHKNEVFICVV